ncbi:TolC family protein, partial [candidate division KSB1 bacterium]|nr:TolC family protein [candidate division KSB1 bacterium]
MIKYIVICFWFTTAILFAQEQLTFQQVISIAMENNFSIRVAVNNAQAAHNSVNIGNADLLPKLDVSSSANYLSMEIPTPDGDQTFETTTASAKLQASYTLFDGFGNIYRFNKLKSGGRAADLLARFQIENVLYAVSAAYYSSALAYENLKIAQQLVEISNERLDRARNKVQFGQANSIQLLSAQVDLNTDSVTVVNAQYNWDQSRRNLNVLLNRDVGTEFIVDSEINFALEPDQEQLIQKALSRNTSYLLEREQLRGAELDLASARSALSPRLALQGSYAYEQSSQGTHITLDDPDKTLLVGATLSLNLFDGFKKQINRQNAMINLQNQQLAEQEERLYLEKDVKDAFESYNNSRFVLELEKKNLAAAELNFKRTQELYSLGQVTNTQFREAQLNLIRAKNNIFTAKFQAKLDELELLRLTGELVKS